MRTRVGVIFGGRSGEHEISVRSAAAVIEYIDKDKYEPVPVAITHDGAWLSPKASIVRLPEKIRDVFSTEALEGEFALIGDTSYNGLTSLRPESESVGIDVVFPVLHGTFGEDGTIQGLLEMAGLPYVGCGVLASSCGMDKVVMKSLFQKAGLPQCKYAWLLRRDFEADPEAVIGRIVSEIGFPAFVKPANLGSSVGVSRAKVPEELQAAIELASRYDRKVIVEEALKMREIECGVLGNDYPEASRPGEYVIRDKSKAFLDYTEKYAGTGNNEFVVPAPVSAELETKIRDMSLTAFKAIDGSGLARVDFFLRTDNGMLLINEINTMPGLTDASGYPKMWAGSGVSFTEVIDQLISLAIERHADRSRNLTSLQST
ncbi:MAG: D-alanine--D-alanine ligase [Acidobacteria bacterium]|nr:D-alanine--D-alanine ligase [Acidobacteriota bacterium]